MIQERVRRDIEDAEADRASDVGLWYPAPEDLHMTVLEVAHSRSAGEIQELLDELGGRTVTLDARFGDEQEPRPLIDALTNRPHDLHAHSGALLAAPRVSYDAHALALSFLPVPLPCTPEDRGGSGHTYHHLRRDIHALLREHAPDVRVRSRYAVPSAHLTIARFVGGCGSGEGIDGGGGARLLQRVVAAVDGVNEELERGLWGEDGGQWSVGEEVGLDLRAGECWYGAGWSVAVGRGV